MWYKPSSNSQSVSHVIALRVSLSFSPKHGFENCKEECTVYILFFEDAQFKFASWAYAPSLSSFPFSLSSASPDAVPPSTP